VEETDGDPAVVTACEAYAGPLYSYCLWLLADEERAITALVELFVGAQRLGVRLGDPRLSRWLLYAMVRPGCLRVSGEQDRPWPADMADSFAWTDGLDRAQREVLELSVRHGLDEQDVALVLGVSSDTVRTLLADARAALDAARVVRTLISADCDELTGQLALAPPPEPSTVVQLHAAQCLTCGERLRNATLIPTRLAQVTAPPTLRPRILRELADNYPALAGPVTRALGENTPSTPQRGSLQSQSQSQPQSQPRLVRGRRRRGVVTAAFVIISLGVTALWLTGASNAKSLSSGHVATGAGATGAGTSPAPVHGDSTSTSPDAASESRASPSHGGTTTSPTARTTATTVPIGTNPSPGSSASPVGPPSPTPSTSTSSGPALGVTWKQGPQTMTITLTAIATAGAPVQWSVSVSDDFLRVSQPSGVLAPGGSQTVTVTVDPSLAPHGPWQAKIFVDPGNTVVPVNGKGKNLADGRMGGVAVLGDGCRAGVSDSLHGRTDSSRSRNCSRSFGSSTAPSDNSASSMPRSQTARWL
jgi:DNA-binding CsgD family transcriptional regulator